MTIARTRTKVFILGVLINLYLIDFHVTRVPVFCFADRASQYIYLNN